MTRLEVSFYEDGLTMLDNGDNVQMLLSDL